MCYKNGTHGKGIGTLRYPRKAELGKIGKQSAAPWALLLLDVSVRAQIGQRKPQVSGVGCESETGVNIDQTITDQLLNFACGAVNGSSGGVRSTSFQATPPDGYHVLVP